MSGEAKRSSGRMARRSPLHKAVPLAAPYALQVYSCGACNFKCVYCAHSSPHSNLDRSMMPWELFLEAMEQARELTPRYKIIRLHGIGEPLLHPRLAGMVEHIKRSKLAERIEITTNGSLLSNELARDLVSAGVTRFIVSLQGTSADDYKKVCGVDIDFERFVEQLRYLYRHRGNCVLHFKTVDTALTEETKPIFFKMFGPICDTINIDNTLPLFKCLDVPDFVLARRQSNIQGEPVAPEQCCTMIFYNAIIAQNGDVYGCCAEQPPVIGNIRKERLSGIWNGKRHLALLRRHLQGRAGSIAACKDCAVGQGNTTLEDRLEEHAPEILARLDTIKDGGQ